jgi:hypothetical protein
VTNRRGAQTFLVQRRRRRKTSLDDHPITVTGPAVTNGAVNIEALAPLGTSKRREVPWRLSQGLIGGEKVDFISN